MRIAQVSPMYEAVPPRLYGGTERVVAHLADAPADLLPAFEEAVTAAEAVCIQYLVETDTELLATYFAHYTRVVFLSQTDDPELLALARRAAARLGLAFEHRATGLANLAAPIMAFAAPSRGPRIDTAARAVAAHAGGTS